MNTIEKVIKGGYCVGCGACAVASRDVKLHRSTFGELTAVGDLSGDGLDQVCPFATSVDETTLAEELFPDALEWDARVGRFEAIYIGATASDEDRLRSSSGGVVTWLLSELLRKGEIDAVIHVRPNSSADSISTAYRYEISESSEEVSQGVGSRYFPVEPSDVVRKVLAEGPRRYAFVGTPCAVKAMRLLCRSNSELAERIAFCIAIFCGHMKSVAFSEMIGWQIGVEPRNLRGVDFRVKRIEKSANNYGVSVSHTDKEGRVTSTKPIPVKNIIGMDWGLGYFKLRACDWCDDVAGEVGDFSAGDAWLPGVQEDGRGNSIFVSRNRRLESIISDGIGRNALIARRATPNDVYESQAGNYRHRWDGLISRENRLAVEGVWHPIKRRLGSTPSPDRERVYRLREELANQSRSLFVEAKDRRSFLYFVWRMSSLEVRYARANRRLLWHIAKMALNLVRFLARKVGVLAEGGFRRLWGG